MSNRKKIKHSSNTTFIQHVSSVSYNFPQYDVLYVCIT